MQEFLKVADFIGDCFSKLWNVCSNYWWVVAGLCIPLVFILFDLIFDFAYGKGIRKEIIKDKSFISSSVKKYFNQQKYLKEKEEKENAKEKPEYYFFEEDGRLYYNKKMYLDKDGNRYYKKSNYKKSKKNDTDSYGAYDLDLFEKMLNQQD